MKKFYFIIFSVAFCSSISFSQITSKKSGDWNSSSTWNGGSIPNSSSQVIISDGHTVTINTNAFCRNLTIGQGGANTATLTFDNNPRVLSVSGSTSGYIYISSNGVLESTDGVSQTIYIAGDFTNNGIFTQGSNNTVNFNGSSLRNIIGSNIVFNNLTINNSGGISLSTNIIVNNTLTLSNGLFYASNDTLTVNGNISATSPGITKMIVLDDGTNFGRLKLSTAGNKSYTFPVGDTRGTTEYSPITINLIAGANSNSYLAVDLKNLKEPNNTSISNYLNRYWLVTPSGLSTISYDISINYLNADVVGYESQLYFAKYDAGVWTLLGQPNISTNTFATTGLSSFSSFTGGEQGALPVHLQSLYSSISGRNVKINWVTASENNNKGFEIMRATVDKSGNTGSFSSIGFIKGKGTSNQPNSYNFSDNNLSTGKYKYRLKQIDINGNFELFDLSGFVEIGVPEKFSVSQNYPNPFNPVTKIDFELPSDGRVSLTVYDISGREVTKIFNNEFKNAGYHTIDFNANKLSSGIYFYRLISDNNIVTKKMTLIK